MPDPDPADATYREIAKAGRKGLKDLATGQISAYSGFGTQFTFQNIGELQRLVEWAEDRAAEEEGAGPNVTVADFRTDR